MAVTCANCGEELLGAVNRCWRCGRHVLSAPGSGEAPPVRQIPPRNIGAAVQTATIVIAESGEMTDAAASEIEPPLASAAPPALAPPASAPANDLPPRPADYSQRGIVDAAAIVSIVLGALALIVGVFFSWALVFGLLGIGAGLWGFKSRWRHLAIIGLLVSLMGVCGSSARLAFDAFAWWTGQSVLGPTTPAESTLPDSLE